VWTHEQAAITVYRNYCLQWVYYASNRHGTNLTTWQRNSNKSELVPIIYGAGWGPELVWTRWERKNTCDLLLYHPQLIIPPRWDVFIPPQAFLLHVLPTFPVFSFVYLVSFGTISDCCPTTPSACNVTLPSISIQHLQKQNLIFKWIHY
jgi:hypothetical protein